MKAYRFIHTADWHATGEPEKLAKLTASLDQLLNYVMRNETEYILIAGDIWDSKQSYNENSGVPVVLKYLSRLAQHVKYIFITKGNNSHDNPGSISLLHQLEPNIYAYEYPVCLLVDADGDDDDRAVIDIMRDVENVKFINPQYIVSLVPYPTKAMFIAEDSIDNNNAEFIEKFEQVFELIGSITENYNCPKTLGFHGNVVGSRLSSGQTLVSQDIMVAPSTLLKAKADYYALGHIHLRQVVFPNMAYSGSIYNKNWGETEQKSFEVVETGKATVHYPCPIETARPMITINAEYVDGILIDESGADITTLVPINAEFRIKIKVTENDRATLTTEKLDQLKAIYGHELKTDLTVIPNVRESRSEAIMYAKSLADEVMEYGEVTGVFVPDSVIAKVNELQEEGL